MANITKLLVNTTNEKIYASATSSGEVTETTTVTHHKFTNFKIDYTSTFTCTSEPSDYATTIPITANWDTDLTDYEINFSSLLSEDPANDLFFIWLEETATATKTLSTANGFVERGGTNLYFKLSNGKYYMGDISNITSTVGLRETNQSAYEAAELNKDTNYTVGADIDINDKNYYLYVTANSQTNYFKVDVSAPELVTINKDVFTAAFTSTTLHYYLGITLSVRDLYDIILKHIDIKDERCCNIDCSSVDYILAWNGFNLAKSLGNYRQMIYYWKLLHNESTFNSNCSCNG